jgi:N-methylhydantoinase A/oxoprolinase/acetone carboxylase beta subunit
MAGLCRIGVDVGGTNTDAVVLSPFDVPLGWAKQPTSKDVLQGVLSAVTQALQDAKLGTRCC